MPSGLTQVVNSTTLETFIVNLATNISIVKVINILTAGAGVCIGLVFLWWAVRKVTSMLMSAFRNGKLSI